MATTETVGSSEATAWRSRLSRLAGGLTEASWLTVLAVVPLVVNPYSRQIFEPDKTAVLTILATVMALAALLRAALDDGLRRDATRRVWRRAAGWTGLVALSLALSTLLSIDPHRSWLGSYVRRQGAVTEGLLLVVFLVVGWRLASRAQWLRAATVLVLASVPICVYTLFQRLGFDPVPWDYSLRVGATAGNPVFLAAYLALVVPVTLALAAEQFREGDEARWHSVRLGLLVYACGVQLAALFFTESRGPIVALAVGLTFMGLTATRMAEATALRRKTMTRRLRWALVALALGSTVTLAGLGLARGGAGEIPVVGRLATALSPEATTNRVRLAAWQGAARRFAHPMTPRSAARPWIGHGPETFSLAFLGVAQASWSTTGSGDRIPDRAHNEIWELLVTRGLFGIACWLALLAFLAVTGLRDLGLLPDRTRALALAAWTAAGAGGAAALALALGRVEILGPAVGCGLAGGLVAFSAFVPQPAGAPALPRWRRLAALALLTSCLVHWVEIQVGFGTTLTRAVFFILAAALVGLRRGDAARAETAVHSPRRNAVILGLALAAALTCFAFGLSSSAAGRNAPAELLLGSLVSQRPAPAVTPVLTALVAALAVGWALLAMAPANGPARGAAWRLAATAVLPAAVVTTWIHGSSLHDPAVAIAPADAAATAAASFRALVFAVLAVLAALAVAIAAPARRQAETRPWLPAAVTALLVAGVALLSGPLALARVEADTFAKHGLAWLERGAPEIGHPLLDRASRLDPGEPTYWLERGRLDLEVASAGTRGRPLLADATRSLERATELAPLEADAWANLGLARLLSSLAGTRDPNFARSAQDAMEHALELRPAWPPTLVQAARVAALRGDETAAEAWLAEARRLEGGDAQ